MRVTITENEEQFYVESARRIADMIQKKPNAKIGFSTGRTTKGVHAALVKLQKEKHFDCSKLTVFGIDEITNMSRKCPASCYYILLHEVVKPLGVSMKKYIMPDPMSVDLEAECKKFEKAVEADGGPDMIFLGLGENGHLGFNQPGTPFGCDTNLSWMDDRLNERLRRENNISADVKMGGLTLGIRNLMKCQYLVMGANGENKRSVVKKMIYGPVTEELPASIMQLHPCFELILDLAAAENLPGNRVDERY